MKRIKTGALPIVSTPYPTRSRADQAQRIRQRRAASRSKPPKTATGGKIGHCGIQRIACRRITLRLHANVALPSDVLNRSLREHKPQSWRFCLSGQLRMQ
nr:hypothetical protein [Methylomarinum sp. Ch1-1]MDP4522899.1 hypothetical protein [Methylomarinum sp. Ch1-1]